MCYKLQNRLYLLTTQTILGALLVVLALPILGVSSYLFIDNVGISLSPIWLAILVEVTGLIAVLTWPSKLIIITLSVPPLCILSILTCVFSGALTCFYGSIVYARGVDDVTAALNVSAPGVSQTSFCLFNNVSNFFSPEIETQFYFMETLVPSCQGLDRSAPYLLVLCILTIMCLLISVALCVVSALTLLSCKQDKGEIGDSNILGDSDVTVQRLRKRPYVE